MKKPMIRPDQQCKILSFAGDELQGTNFKELLVGPVSVGDDFFTPLNCSIEYTSSVHIGNRLPDNSFDGAIGNVSRGEYNVTHLVYVLGSIDEPPIIEGNVYWTSELNIFSIKDDDNRIPTGMEYWFKNFDTETYIYSATSILLFVFWFLLLYAFDFHSIYFRKCRRSYKKLLGRRPRRRILKKMKWKVLKRSIKTCFKMLPRILISSILSIIDEHFYSSKESFKLKILTSFYLLAIFNLMFGYYLNFISVDMVAIQPAETLDTLVDLFGNPKYNNLSVVTCGGLHHESSLKTSSIDSNEFRLSNKISNYVRLTLDNRIFKTFAEYLEPFKDGKIVLVLDMLFVNVMRSIGCQLEVIDPSAIHKSKETFAERLQTNMMSKTNDPYFVKYVRHKGNLLLQSQILPKLSRDFAILLSANPAVSEHRKMMCIDGYDDDETTLPGPFLIQFFAPLIKIYFTSMLISYIILNLEVVYFKAQKYIRRLL